MSSNVDINNAKKNVEFRTDDQGNIILDEFDMSDIKDLSQHDLINDDSDDSIEDTNVMNGREQELRKGIQGGGQQEDHSSWRKHVFDMNEDSMAYYLSPGSFLDTPLSQKVCESSDACHCIRSLMQSFLLGRSFRHSLHGFNVCRQHPQEPR